MHVCLKCLNITEEYYPSRWTKSVEGEGEPRPVPATPTENIPTPPSPISQTEEGNAYYMRKIIRFDL